MTAYYNEIDPYAAQWLRNLIQAGHIAPGDVDERSIVDVQPDDLRAYTQCHFFAGIGGWSLALRLAGWPDDRPVWTGSCPCQPFSSAGAAKAADDSRHLWPAWFPLIRELEPATIFGEQVDAAIGWGWLDAVFVDLEEQGYACGATVLPACGVGAPHVRNRLWFVANAPSEGGYERNSGAIPQSAEGYQSAPSDEGNGHAFVYRGQTCELANTNSAGLGEQRRIQLLDGERTAQRHDVDGRGASVSLVHAAGKQTGLPGRTRQPRATPWTDLIWLPCADGKTRPTKSGIFPLAHGVSARVGKLRAAGNAIVPQVAAEFIAASIEAMSEHL